MGLREKLEAFKAMSPEEKEAYRLARQKEQRKAEREFARFVRKEARMKKLEHIITVLSSIYITFAVLFIITYLYLG